MSQSSSKTKTPAKPDATKPAKPKIEWRDLNPYIGAACLLLAIGMWVTTPFPSVADLAPAALTLAAIGFLIYWRDLRPWEQVPRWKRITFTTLIFLGVACVILYLITQLSPSSYF